jgi:DNA (cytosine-5)-methyltransferase 1
MKHISLFSGIGGFDLAAEWAGWTNVASCEINDFGNKVLEYYWPQAYHHRDIHTLTGQILNDEIQQRFGSDWKTDGTILTVGFPCQPYSTAGKRLGKEDERHLWPEMLRVICEVQPEWIVGENVRGLVSWSGGLVFEEVWSDLETIGYEVQPFILPAASVNAPHKRERIWFVAYSDYQRGGKGFRQVQAKDGEIPKRDNYAKFSYSGISDATNAKSKSSEWLQPKQYKFGNEEQGQFRGVCCKNGCWDAANANSRRQPSEKHWQEKPRWASKKGIPNDWSNFPIEPAVCSRNDGFSERLDSITFPKWRNESIKAAGNAIVPQVAYQIFKAINDYRNL